MNLFDVYPQLSRHQTPALYQRSLRLIALAGIVFDEQAFYFELGDSRFWGRLPQGGVSIGAGTVKVRPDRPQFPHQTLVRHVRQQWQCEVKPLPSTHAYVLGDDNQVEILADVEASTPYILILTAPQLGGADMPDALVQAVYLLPVHRWRGTSGQSLLQIRRDALDTFLEPVDWPLDELRTQPWASLSDADEMPQNARVRPVLALRGLQALLKAGALPLSMHAAQISE